MGLISVPNINRKVLRACDKWLIVASDGLYDVVGDDEAVGLIWKEENAMNAAKLLVSTGIKKGSMDNIMCIVVRL